ncbi:MAG: glycosyltransferase family 4 protein [Candidatus Aminicenantes bacterium]|nr:glycosyltransferase family 4 protein [Candidatus Aminicenantes bacterium]
MSQYRKLIPKPVKQSVKNLLSRITPTPTRCDHAVRTIAICAAQVPFSYGGAENLTAALRNQLSQRGFDVDVIAIPFKWYPAEQIVNSINIWRQLDLSEANGKKIDLLITTKFPSYMANHPNKVLWLVHQFRQAYDLHETPISGFDPKSRADQELRSMLIQADQEAIKGHKRIFTISRNVSQRLLRFNSIASTPLYHPPKLHPRYRHEHYGDYILSVGRLDKLKRVDWLIRALRFCPATMRCVIAGSGPELLKLKELARKVGVADRVNFLGYVDDQRLLELYGGCFSVYFAPIDEDYGYVTLEAFLSQKPVLTAADSGGTLEFVEHERNGYVIEPENEKLLADKISLLFSHRQLCRRFGVHGHDKVRNISWDHVVQSLLGQAT